MLEIEEWKPVVGYEGTYEVSSFGRVKRVGPARGLVPGKIRKLVPRNGYYQLVLSQGGEISLQWVHRLVALAFIPQPDGMYQVNHIDGNRQNNRADNLEWCTHSGNAIHAYGTGLRQPSPNKGSKNGNAILSESDIPVIREAAKNTSYATIGKKYGISRQSIYRIVHRLAWQHVP